MKLLPPIIPGLDIAREDLSSLIGKLFATLKAATSEARNDLQIHGEEDESYFSHQVRYLVKAALRRDQIEAEDECEIGQTASTGLCIRYPRYMVRILRDVRRGSLPPSGDSDRRERFFAQKSEQGRLFGDPTEEGIAECEREPSHVVFLWATNGMNQFTGFWFVCPNGEKAAPHFQEWMELPSLGESVLQDTEAPTEVLPPANLGLTRKDERVDIDVAQTGTEPNE